MQFASVPNTTPLSQSKINAAVIGTGRSAQLRLKNDKVKIVGCDWTAEQALKQPCDARSTGVVAVQD